MGLWSQNNSQIIYYIILKMPILSACFSACLFKCKWTAAARPLFQNRAVPLQLIPQILCQKTSVWFCLSCIMRWNHVLNHISLNIWNRVFWAHIFEARAQKAAVTRRESTKLSSLSCLIELKMWNTHKFMLKTHELQKQPVMSVKVNGWERNHVHIRSVWQHIE